MCIARLLTTAAATLTLAACDLPFATGCDAYAAPGLEISVTDSATGLPVNDSLRLVARSGTYADSAEGSVYSSGHFSMAYERPGVYTVSATHPRARAWSRDGIRVRSDRCHVIPTQVNVRLQMVR